MSEGQSGDHLGFILAEESASIRCSVDIRFYERLDTLALDRFGWYFVLAGV